MHRLSGLPGGVQAVERARARGARVDRRLPEPRPLHRQDVPARAGRPGAACPTDSIQFGFRDELVAKANKRVETLKGMGFKDAQLYGADSGGFLGGLNAFFLLLAKPATYNLPDNPTLPQRNVVVDSLLSIGSAVLVGLGAMLAFRERGKAGK